MNPVLKFNVYLLTFCLFSAGVVSAAPLKLAADGNANYVIVLPEKPTAVEQTAAKELKQHLDAVTGGNFGIVREPERSKLPPILIGNTRQTKELLPELDTAKLRDDEIIIKTAGTDSGQLVLTGHPQRGTLYAVYTFLEETVGVRWWSSTETFLPKKPSLEVPEQNVRYAPKLIYREAHYCDAYEGVFAARMKFNGHFSRTTPEYGGHFQFCSSAVKNIGIYSGFVHTFYPLLPPQKYFAAHPEWYSEINGQRKHDHAQLCLTNDEMRAEFTKNALLVLRANPDAGFISVSQNDCYGFCTCKECQKIADEEGAQSGLLLRFVNSVAEEIEKEFPHVWVETLAYQYTRKPPKTVKPRKNVVIRLCSIECSYVQPLSGEQNKKFREDIEGWSKIAEHLFIWDYVTNFSSYMMPHPNLRILKPNIQFFVHHHTIGLFEQGDNLCGPSDFAGMRAWLLSRLEWNPDLDANRLMDEFITGYYGADAAPFVKEYWNLLLDSAEKSGVYLRCYMNTTKQWLPQESAKRAFDLMEQALSAAKDETFRTRLRRDKMPVDFVMLTDYPGSCSKDFAADFIRRCEEFKVATFHERFDAPGREKSVQEMIKRIKKLAE